MPETVKVAEDVKEEAKKTINALKSIGDGKGKSVDDLKDKFLD
jgi:hypothetical protein